MCTSYSVTVTSCRRKVQLRKPACQQALHRALQAFGVAWAWPRLAHELSHQLADGRCAESLRKVVKPPSVFAFFVSEFLKKN